MVALFGFFDACQIGVEILLGEKRRAINPLELGILFVSQPVGAGDVEQLEGFDFSVAGMCGPRRNPETAGFIDGDFFIGLGELLDEVALHEVAFTLELFQTFFARRNSRA